MADGGPGSLMQTNAVTNVGNITYNRFTTMRLYDYTYWSSPVTNQNLALFSMNTLSDKYLSWDANAYSWIYHNAALTTMTAAKGYAIRVEQTQPAGGGPWTGVFKGVPQNGNYSILLFHGPGPGLQAIGSIRLAARKPQHGRRRYQSTGLREKQRTNIHWRFQNRSIY